MIMKDLVLLLILFLVISNCSDNGLNFNLSEIEEDYSSIENPKERWEAYQLKDYYIEQKWVCECLPPDNVRSYIVNNEIVKIELDDNNKSGEGDQSHQYSNQDYEDARFMSMSIDQAFRLIEENENTAHSIRVSYHPKFGYPTELYIDYSMNIADEKTHHFFNNLKNIF